MEHNSGMGTVILVCGLPGAGKTTHALRLCVDGRSVRLCPDDWMQALGLDLYDEERRARIEALQWRLAQEILPLGAGVVIEWGTWGRAERDALRLGARAQGARVVLHYLRAPLDVLYERVSRRGMDAPSITRSDLARWAAAFQEPTEEEMGLFDGALVLDQRTEL